MADFIIYTGSDPDAGMLVDYLRSRDFVIPSDDISSAAMVVVVETKRKTLMNALKDTKNPNFKYWKVKSVSK